MEEILLDLSDIDFLIISSAWLTLSDVFKRSSFKSQVFRDLPLFYFQLYSTMLLFSVALARDGMKKTIKIIFEWCCNGRCSTHFIGVCASPTFHSPSLSARWHLCLIGQNKKVKLKKTYWRACLRQGDDIGRWPESDSVTFNNVSCGHVACIRAQTARAKPKNTLHVFVRTCAWECSRSDTLTSKRDGGRCGMRSRCRCEEYWK